MISRLEFDAGWTFGPKTFAEITGRNKLWSKDRPSFKNAVLTNPRPCPLCDKRAARSLFRSRDGWLYVKCTTCGMVYQPQPPSEKALNEYYKSGGAPQDWVQHTQQNSIEMHIDKLKFRWALEWAGWPPRIGKTPEENSRILDWGCSTGTLLQVASEITDPKRGPIYTSQTVGVEINDDARKIAAERVLGTFGANGVPDNAVREYDLVCCWETLEHVFEPLSLMRRLVAHLKPGGTMLICVPNIDALAARVMHEACPMFGMGHLSMFNAETLSYAIRRELPGARIEFNSIVSFSRELQNWIDMRDPFSADPPRETCILPREILNALKGYKLVAKVTT